MKAADVVVARAGATTLAELAASGTPAILVPLPTAADDHQRQERRGVARTAERSVIEERDLTGERLAAELLTLAQDPARRDDMGRAARTLARPDAAERIADRRC